MHVLTYDTNGEESRKITIKTKSGKVIFHNSDNYNNITINLADPIIKASDDNIFLISLNSLQIPISWPLISSYKGNNKIEYIINGTTYTYLINNCSYTALELLDELNTNLLLNVSFDTKSYKYIFTHDTYEFTLTENTTCYTELGFYNKSYTSSSLSLTSEKAIDLAGTREIYIRTNMTTNNIDSSDCRSSSNMLDAVPLDVDNYNVLKYTNYEGFKVKIFDPVIQHINIRITDDDDQEIDIKHHYSLTIEINEIKNIKSQIKNIDFSKIISP